MKRFGNWLVEIRPYSLEDRLPLIETINAVCAEGRWMETLCYEPTPLWEHALRNPQCSNHLLLVAEVNVQIAGWCRLFRLPNCCDKTSRTAELGIGLLPAYRGSGIGTALVLHACQEAPSLNIERIVLSTRKDNQSAIHVFKRCGFNVHSREECGIITMVCPLVISPAQRSRDDEIPK